MLESASMMAAYLSFVLLHAADPDRLPARLGTTVSTVESWRLGAQLGAALLFGLSIWLWSEAASGAVVWAGPLAAWMIAAIVVVLLRPRWGRWVWGTAVVCAPTMVLLALLGGPYGG
ncbi:MAG: hypothetical protein ACOCV2_12190 [Persicimonas sp.]